MTNLATIYAALLGALAAAFAQFLVARHRYHARRHAILRALVAEVGVLAELVRMQYRPRDLKRLGQSIACDPAITVFPIDPALQYFTVYEGLSGNLGALAEEQATTIVEFYTFYKVAIGLASRADDGTAIDDAVVDLLLDLAQRIDGMGESGAGRPPPQR